MKTIKAIYDHGKIIFLEKSPENIRDNEKVLITFLDDTDLSEFKFDRSVFIGKEKGIKFPTKDLGKIINIDRGNIYAQYLSNRY